MMGNKLSNNKVTSHLQLLMPRPSDQAIMAATLDAKTVIKREDIIHLTIIDRQTAETYEIPVLRSLTIRFLRDHFADKFEYEAEELELRMNGGVIDPKTTVDEIGLKNGMRLHVSRIKMELESWHPDVEDYLESFNQRAMEWVNVKLRQWTNAVSVRNSRVSGVIEDVEQPGFLSLQEAEHAQDWIDRSLEEEKSIGNASRKKSIESDLSRMLGTGALRPESGVSLKRTSEQMSKRDSDALLNRDSQQMLEGEGQGAEMSKRGSEHLSTHESEPFLKRTSGLFSKRSSRRVSEQSSKRESEPFLKRESGQLSRCESWQASKCASGSRSGQVKNWVERNSQERVDDEERMRELFNDRIKRKSQLAADKFGWE